MRYETQHYRWGSTQPTRNRTFRSGTKYSHEFTGYPLFSIHFPNTPGIEGVPGESTNCLGYIRKCLYRTATISVPIKVKRDSRFEFSWLPKKIHFNPQISQITQITMNVRWRLRNLPGLIPRSLPRGSSFKSVI